MAQQPGYGDPAFTAPPPFEPGNDRFAGPPAIVAAREAHRFGQMGDYPPPAPSRPTYREPHPVRVSWFLTGLGGGVFWMVILPLLGTSITGYGWWTLIAGGVAWAAAAVLARAGDRGAAAGIAISVGLAWATAAYVLAGRWAETADWPLW
ncbi:MULTISPECIES: hypothetical protein [Catenuloplanes]|uniref:Uncharacterized protein n=1 Tax=Catenuloplanes niger TaxID=587534 RepID=A0AAE3ZQW3_9ACTN|nr:hypothetical protein [Catenuloplanes niger]MDR7323271.1 hypothetical protein [Catenuloplanes niger]